ncbi:MAG: hypothetical protein R3D03_14270 [Geminicoccaceae bacterium]
MRSIELAMISKYDLGISVEVDLDEAGAAGAVRPDQIQQVIVNLVRNAAEAVAGCDRRELQVASRLREAMSRSALPTLALAFRPRCRQHSSSHSIVPSRVAWGWVVDQSHDRRGAWWRVAGRAAEGGGTVFSFNLPLQVHADA